jgi:hypothetical protein
VLPLATVMSYFTFCFAINSSRARTYQDPYCTIRKIFLVSCWLNVLPCPVSHGDMSSSRCHWIAASALEHWLHPLATGEITNTHFKWETERGNRKAASGNTSDLYRKKRIINIYCVCLKVRLHETIWFCQNNSSKAPD